MRRNIWISLSLLIFNIVYSVSVFAADLMEVSPITNKILMVYVRDGFIDNFGVNQNPYDAINYHNPVNLNNLQTLGNYVISSSDDGNYTSAKNPIAIGRKDKATDYNDQWQAIPYVMGHWVYIELPTGLVQGKNYTIQLNNMVENKNSISFIYDVNKLRSPTVHVNMVGFTTSGPKYAYLSQWMGDFNTGTHSNGGLELDDKAGAQFRVIRVSDGTVATSGTISKRADKSLVETGSGDFGDQKNYSHSDVWQCDFSTLQTAGDYYVAVDGIGRSYNFTVGNNITREPFYYSMKGLFWQRQGIVKEIEPGKIMPRDHHPDDIAWKWDKNWAGAENNVGFNEGAAQRVYGIWGHYQDAGDWDGYIRHAKTPMSLLLLFDLQPSKFKDGDIGNKYKLWEGDANWINEGINGLPDLLDEAVWLIDYYKRARTVLQSNYGGTGGVPGYVGRDAIPSRPGFDGGNNYTAWQDPRDWWLSAENVEQTFLYSALSAWYATCLNKFYQLTNSGNHPDYTNRINEATAAYNWANAKYSTSNTEQMQARGIAAVCLYRATANITYQTAFETYYNWEPTKGYGEWESPNIFDLAISIYSLIPAGHIGLNTTLQTTCKQTVQNQATGSKLDNINANAFRCQIEYYQGFQLGAFSTPRTTLMAVAHNLTGDAKYLDGMKNAANYVLGGNQLNMTYISNLGENSDNYVFHPNSYLINDYNSKVYNNDVLDGFTTYFGANSYWFYSGQGSEYWTKTAAFPQAANIPNEWPEGESKFYNRYSIQGGEFTVNQNSNYMIYTMGYINALSGSSTSAYSPNVRPTVSLNLTEGQLFPANGYNLTASASADTKCVKYYYDWHYIGSSNDAASNFAVFWDPIQSSGNVIITAVAYDDKGVKTIPTDGGDKNVTISTATSGGTSGTRLEAENGSLGNGTWVWDASAASNGKAVGGFDVTGAYIEWYNVPSSSSIKVGYSVNVACTQSLYVNNAKVATMNFPATSAFSSITLSVNIPANATVKIQRDAGDTHWTDIDYIEVSGTASSTGCIGTGSITFKKWNGVAGTAISELTALSIFPNSPSSTSTINQFRITPDVGESYGVQVIGSICPPTSGNYTFWIAGDDNVDLYLSTSNSPANKTRIAYHTDWTGDQEWNKYSTQKSGAIALTAGQLYYIEALMKEGAGGDNLAVGWAKPGQSTASPSEVIPGSALKPYAGGTQSTTKLEAETATLGNGTWAWTTTDASNGQAVGGYDATGAYVQWSNVPASSTLKVGYSVNQATTKSLYVNNTKVATLNFPAVSGFSSITVNQTIPAGATVKIQRDAADTYWTDIDYIEVVTNGAREGIAKEKAKLSHFTLFPNPSTGSFKLALNALEAGNAQISVTNLWGHEVYLSSVDVNEGSNLYEINLSGKPSGIYFIHVKSQHLFESNQLIIR